MHGLGDMVELHCPHVGVCGGCVERAAYDEQLRAKLERTQQEFSTLYNGEIELYPSSELGYRARAEFRFYREYERVLESSLESSSESSPDSEPSPHAAGRLHFAMSAQGANHRIPITSCPILLPSLQALMPPLLEALNASETLGHKIYGCNLLSTLGYQSLDSQISESGTPSEVIITLIYHKSLDEAWSKEAEALRDRLARLHGGVLHLIGRSKNQKLLFSSDLVSEKISLFTRKGASGGDLKGLEFAILESKFSESRLPDSEILPPQEYIFTKQEARFSQPNPAINRHMLECIIRALYKQRGGKSEQSEHGDKNEQSKRGDLLELYCGGGNFTLALAPHFRRVLATEVVKSAITLLHHNMRQNAITNITPVRLNASESIAALRGEREFFRLRGVDMDFEFEAVLVDPPRSGISDRAVLEFLSDFPYIIYISCNPTSLREDLEILGKSHKIAHFALFDQFPHTPHRECALVLKRQ